MGQDSRSQIKIKTLKLSNNQFQNSKQMEIQKRNRSQKEETSQKEEPDGKIGAEKYKNQDKSQLVKSTQIKTRDMKNYNTDT